MKIVQINRTSTGLFSIQQLDMVYNQNRFIPFIEQAFSKDAFEDALDRKKENYSKENRTVLVDVLAKQYANITATDEVNRNIAILQKDSTFTITTGHQLSLFTGPAYFVYKILHVIKQCEELKKVHPENDFVPIYWMASEDHDFEEIQSMHLFNQSVTWESEQKGPVGRFDLEGIQQVKEQLKSFFGNHLTSELVRLIDDFSGDTYGKAFRKFVHGIFGRYGLVILDGDDPQLKKIFAPIMKKELSEQFALQAVELTNEELHREGAKIQVTPRDINLFYIEKGFRERIVKFGDRFEIEGKGTFTLDELNKMLDSTPASFSPNVVLRPLYQEFVLPNLCYVGGAGEISYWLQLKRVFQSVNVVYPLIQVRNSVIWIDANSADKMEKLQLTIDDIFRDADALKKRFVEAHSSEELDFSKLNAAILALKEEMISTVAGVDENLNQFAIAETVRVDKQLDALKDKLFKQSKAKHEKALKMIDQLKEKLFPGNGLQERKTNFFQLTPDGNFAETVDVLKNNMLPFSGDLLVVKE